MFHGCSLETALNAAINGLSGQIRIGRSYSYENGMNPKGLFVSPDFNISKNFAYDTDTMVIIEFTAKSDDLDTPVWNHSHSYFGQGSNPQPFSSREERDNQKQIYQDYAKNCRKEYISNSDNPAMAYTIFDDCEHQALFVGNLNPNMIKRFWIKKNGGSEAYIPLSRKQFLKIYGNREFQKSTYNGYENYKVKRNTMPYLPNEDFVSIEDMIRKRLSLYFKDNPKLRAEYSDEEYEDRIKEETEMYETFFVDAVKNNNYDDLRHYFGQLLYPKQLKQLFGDELYNEIYKNDLM